MGVSEGSQKEFVAPCLNLVPALSQVATLIFRCLLARPSTQVILPGALPNIVTGIRTGLGFAWRGLIAAEMIATNVGLGYMLFLARDFYKTEVIVLGMIIIGLIWLAIDRLILAPVERATIERWGMVRRA